MACKCAGREPNCAFCGDPEAKPRPPELSNRECMELTSVVPIDEGTITEQSGSVAQEMMHLRAETVAELRQLQLAAIMELRRRLKQ